MDKLDGLSLNVENQNIEKLKELFPEVVEEGKINFDMLRTFLGDEVDDAKEKYQFTWKGKTKAIKLSQTPSSATLRPCKEKSKDWDSTENLYIEGDNLEVLKQLQKTYNGKIKMIYIDPPYNTGNDFVYRDDFSDSLENYKKQTNQISSSNPEKNGRFHTDWLNMMYPRLLLAKNLLSEDGVIFISIGDEELFNLKKIMEEVFGENNYIANMIWQSTPGSNTGNDVKTVTENILLFSKDKNVCKFINQGISDSEKYCTTDDYYMERGGFVLNKLDRRMTGNHYSESLNYSIEMPDGTPLFPGNSTTKQAHWNWRWSSSKVKWGIDNGFIVMKKNNNSWTVYFKQYEKVDNENKPIVRTIPYQNFINIVGASSARGTREVMDLFNGKYFDYPKPLSLIKHIQSMILNSHDTILDFFSGSATTAHAVMQLNAKYNHHRKFIMVQLPERLNVDSDTYKAGYKNICDIGEERIRRAGEKIKNEWEKGHNSEEKFTTDIGFKVFKLDSSNINEWDSNLKLDEKELAFRLGEVFKKDRSKEDILYEIMLKYGMFDKQVEELNINNKIMYRVGKRYMIVCLEDDITPNDIKSIGELSPKSVIFNEAGFADDNAKINAVYNLEKAGVEDIKCI